MVQVGENKVSAKYVGEKRKTAKDIGVGFLYVELPGSVSQKKLEKEIEGLATKKSIGGIMVQLPLPSRLNAQKALDLIPVEKDVDVLSSKAFELFKAGKLTILPPTVCAVSLLLEVAGMWQKVHDRKKSATWSKSRKRLKVVIVGRGRLVGLPLSIWFCHQGIEPAIIEKNTPNPSKITKQADILVSAAGKSRLITGDMVKKGAVVIDAGTSIEGGSTRGDVDFESMSKKASYITPVPGGVGPLTVACLFQNLLALARRTDYRKFNTA